MRITTTLPVYKARGRMADNGSGVSQIPINHVEVLTSTLLPDSLIESDDDIVIPETLSTPVDGADTTLAVESVDGSQKSQDTTSELDASIHQCGECGKCLSSKSSLVLHLRRHMKDFNFNCDSCGNKYLTSQRLKEHIAKEHKRTGVTKCKVCGKILGSFRGMREHVKEHKGEVHSCSQCSKTFNTMAKLKRHISSHEKLFKCDTCHKCFGSTAQLKIHSVIHDDQAPKYACTVCAYTSIWKLSVERHVKSKHSDERPYVCDKCGSGFKAKDSLSKHLKRNNCDKPKACEMWEEL